MRRNHKHSFVFHTAEVVRWVADLISDIHYSQMWYSIYVVINIIVFLNLSSAICRYKLLSRLSRYWLQRNHLKWKLHPILSFIVLLEDKGFQPTDPECLVYLVNSMYFFVQLCHPDSAKVKPVGHTQCIGPGCIYQINQED